MSVIFDGFSTTVILDASVGLFFREKTVTPPDLDGGGALDTSDMHNIRMRTASPKSLLSSGDLKMTVYWDPALYGQIVAQCQRNQKITIRFPDASGVIFMGWIEKFTPTEHKEGDNPLADMILHPSHALNRDVNDVKATGNEFVPLFVAGPIAMPPRNV